METDKNKDDSRKAEVSHVSFTVSVEETEPPPPGFTSVFKTLEDWLVNICTTENPGKSIQIYKFGLGLSDGIYMLSLVGINEYKETENHSRVVIEFEPANMHFPLPANEYANLSWQEVGERLKLQFQKFAGSETFKHSYFTKADFVTTPFAGMIWSR